MTDAAEQSAPRHPIYPAGPPCNPNCPGEHSMYHDGYADGYENAEAAAGQPPPDEALRTALFRLHRFTNAIMASKPGRGGSFNDLRHAGTVLGVTTPGQYGDESDPWPDETASFLQESESASPPPTAAPPEDWSEIQHPGYGEGAAPERVSGLDGTPRWYEDRLSLLRSHHFMPCGICGASVDDPEAYEECAAQPAARSGDE